MEELAPVAESCQLVGHGLLVTLFGQSSQAPCRYRQADTCSQDRGGGETDGDVPGLVDARERAARQNAATEARPGSRNPLVFSAISPLDGRGRIHTAMDMKRIAAGQAIELKVSPTRLDPDRRAEDVESVSDDVQGDP